MAHTRHVRAAPPRRAHSGGIDPEGPVKCGGPFGGYASEGDFYRSMFRTNRNNPFMLLVGGLLAIPLISMAVSVANGCVH